MSFRLVAKLLLHILALSLAPDKFQHASVKRRVSDSETRQYNVSHQHEMDLA